MANRFFSPNQQLSDTTGLPYAGGSLTFYSSGTTTPLNTYSDKALTIANTNPVVLDSAGRAGNIFLQNLAYKVVLADVNSNVIWTADPVYASDFSTVAQFQSGSGSPNGSVAGSAGSSTIPASSYWDATNQILYICTQTGTTSTAVWTAINSGSAASVIPPPQGRLTLTSGTPVLATDTTAATSVFYTPYVGNIIPIYSGTSFVPTTFSELTLALTSSQAASTIYDVFVFNNSGVVTIGTGPAWTNSAAGTGARGIGAATTQLTRLNGFWVNTVSMTARNSSNTYTVAANQGTYVGSIFIDGSAGQVSCYLSYGQSRKWGVWNAYNRSRIQMKAGDSTSTWNYNTSTVRPANNSSANSITTFTGLPEEIIRVEETQFITFLNASSLTNAAGVAKIGIGVNSTTVFTGTTGSGNYQYGQAATFNAIFAGQALAKATVLPGIGINTITALESTTTATGINVAYNGAEGSMLMTTDYFG